MQLGFTDLKIYNHGKDKDGSDKVHEVGQVLPVEGLSQSSYFVSTSSQQVEKSNNSTLKLSAWKKITNQFNMFILNSDQTKVITSTQMSI